MKITGCHTYIQIKALGYCDSTLPVPDLLELAPFTHLLVVQVRQ